MIVNGVDANQARITEGYIQGVWQLWLQSYARSQGVELAQPVVLEPRIWFNAAVRSRDFLVPGLIAVIMTLIGAMLTSMVVAREWERGTMEALMVTPIRIGELMVGKLVPYFILGMGGMLLSVAMALWLFDVPLRGSFWALTAASALFMMVALGMGLLISVVARNQFVAGQISILITFLPAFILSGFIFQISSMPARDPGHYPYHSGALFCGDSADAVPGRRYLADRAGQQRCAGGDDGHLPRSGATQDAQAAGCMNTLRRIVALAIKELLAILKDRKSRIVLIGPPLAQLVVFGYAASFDLNHIPVAVYNEDRSAPSRELVARLTGSPHFDLVGQLDHDAQIAPMIDNKEA